MSETEINIQIAEACGWRKVYTGPGSESDNRYILGDSYKTTKDIPDYCNSLDEMHEAEKTLTMAQAWKHINEIAKLQDQMPLDDYMAHHCYHATARQRAEAFLKVIKPTL